MGPESRGARPRGGGWRALRAVLLLLVALVGAGLVSSLVIDLGPTLRLRAERAAAAALGRPVHLGGLSIRVLRGTFVLTDLVIEGPTPQERPFLRARRVEVAIRWANLLQGELLVDEVTLDDWQMVIETFPGGGHTLPRVPGRRAGSAPGRLVTTLAFLRARAGELTYLDHATPWSAVARHLDITVTRTGRYHGRATFSEGTVQIRRFQPMRADLTTTFTLAEGRLVLDTIELRTDGAEARLSGVVELARWPEQRYEVRSRLAFARLRDIFFAGERFSVSGQGEFTGAFRLYKGGRELRGAFTSDRVAVNGYPFTELRGALIWRPERFEVPEARCTLFGGPVRLAYRIAPLGSAVPAMARFEATYEAVDLAALTDFLATEGIRLAGRASGRTRLQWPLGHFARRSGEGVLRVLPPEGVRLLGPSIPEEVRAAAAERAPVFGPFNPAPTLGRVAVGGEVTYSLDPEWILLGPSYLATAATFVRFEGRTAYGARSAIRFHVVSADWQESDRLLAGTLTAFGAPTRAVPMGGYGEFDGVLLGALRRPRVEGRLDGAEMRAWDVVWGRARGRVVVENGYVEVIDGVVADRAAELHVAGRFSLGFRRDQAEELDARVRVTRWPVGDLRNAFDLEAYPIDGLLSGDLHLYGRYRGPFGFGRLEIADGRAYGEPFDLARGAVRFEGDGVRIEGVEILKGGGTITGAARLGWDGSYSFNADGRRLPVETVAALRIPGAPLSGLAQFTASGAGTFETPRYDVRARIADLFVRDEGIGEVTGRIGVRGEVLTLEVEAASPRLAVSGAGRIALTPQADAELTFRFADTVLDPYLRLYAPRLSPYTTTVVSGTLRVVGELADLDRLVVEATVDELHLTLFDYAIRNDGPLTLVLDRHTLRADRVRLIGEGTALVVGGVVDLHRGRVAVQMTGDANLGFLQVFFRDLRSAGRARLVAALQGGLDNPVLTGHATIEDGRIRYFALPHALDGINGRIEFDAAGLRLDGVTATLGGGVLQLGGRVRLTGYLPGDLDVTAVGRGMRLRYPEGMRSTVDAELRLEGDVARPRLVGTVTVRDAVWVKRFETGTELVDFTAGRATAEPPAVEPTLPLAFDLHIVAPSTLRIENPAARIVASADLTLRGTYDRPRLFGRAEIERGEVLFEGNRYVVTRGSIEFADPAKIEPFFDIEAETRVRVPGQTYRVVFRAAGTAGRFVPQLTSDPPLPPLEILAMLFGDLRDPQTAELLALRRPGETEQKLIQAHAARLLASPIASEVGRVVQETFAVDTFQIRPSLGDISAQQAARLTPTARLTIGKRLSDRVYLTFSRALGTPTRDQVILLEYTHSDRLSWVVSQNEDRTYALDFRVRHAF